MVCSDIICPTDSYNHHRLSNTNTLSAILSFGMGFFRFNDRKSSTISQLSGSNSTHIEFEQFDSYWTLHQTSELFSTMAIFTSEHCVTLNDVTHRRGRQTHSTTALQHFTIFVCSDRNEPKKCSFVQLHIFIKCKCETNIKMKQRNERKKQNGERNTLEQKGKKQN